jgi:hypothetical protein
MATLDEIDQVEGGSKDKKKKKKKKKPKKKKKKTANAEGDADEKGGEEDDEDGEEEIPPSAEKEVDPADDNKVPVPPTLPPYMSTASLIGDQSTAKSGHSYAKETLENQKTKTKTKSAQPSIFSGGVLTKFGFGKKSSEAEKKAKVPAEERKSWFGHLNRKAKKDLHQLMGTAEDEKQGVASMKWDTFVGVSNHGSKRLDTPNQSYS